LKCNKMHDAVAGERKKKKGKASRDPKYIR